MAFWGVEVRPGRPFTHSFDRVRGRLRISQATLGIGSSTKKCLLQCNVGDKSPVFLCALLPEVTEYCHLDLEFEEADEVIFSVIGTRSVHLSGYFLGNSRRSILDDDTESYGEDIADTDSAKSTHSSNEDNYEDSFIDDAYLEVFPSSHLLDERESDQEILDKKSKGKKGTRKRLKKRYQPIESDDTNSLQHDIADDGMVLPRVETEDGDNLPISSICKTITAKAGRNIDTEAGETSDNKTENGCHPIITPSNETNVIIADGAVERNMDLPVRSMLPSEEIDPENGLELNKEMAKSPKEEQTLETDSVNGCDAIKEDNLQHTEEKTDKGDLLVTNELDQESPNANDTDLPCNSMPPSDGIRPGNGSELNKEIEKLQHTEEKTDKGDLLVKNGQDEKTANDKDMDLPFNTMLPTDGIGLENDLEMKKVIEKMQLTDLKTDVGDLLVQDEQDHKSGNDKESNPSHVPLLSAEEVGLEYHKKPKKRKQRAKEGKALETLKDEETVQDKEVNKNPTNNKKIDQLYESFTSSTDAGSDGDVKQKKRRKDSAAYGKSPEGENNRKSLGVNIDPDRVVDGDQYEGKKTRKKKKTKVQENERNLDTDISALPVKENRSRVGFEYENVEDKSSQSMSLPNGLTILDLKLGKSSGKTATIGKKVKVHFVGKIRGTGQVFDSNIGKKPFKYRLGAEDIIEGWNVGIDGMRVGGKRKLIIPPSMGYGSEGAGELVPPDSWLEYEIELVEVS